MPTHLATHMAITAQGHSRELVVLLDVVRIAGTGCVTDGAGQLLDAAQVRTFAVGQAVIQDAPALAGT